MKTRMEGYGLSQRGSAFLPPLAPLAGRRLQRAPRVFRDRKDAGLRLADALHPCKSQNPLILAIPRGGVEVGFYVALGLEAPLAVLIVRKLPLPDQPEAGFGAIAEDGSTFIIEHLAAALGHDMVAQIIRQQQQEIRRRVEVLRRGEPLPPLENRTVILVDDGIAMGSTVRAAIAMCRNQRAGRVLVASPVASPSTADELAKTADATVILETPIFLTAVAQVYENWYDVSDQEVIDLMNDYNRIRQTAS
jgi:putative phosphoribosyl transferase